MLLRCLVSVVVSLAFAVACLAGAGQAFTPVTIERPAELQQRLDAALVAKGPDYVPRTEHLLPDGRPRGE